MPKNTEKKRIVSADGGSLIEELPPLPDSVVVPPGILLPTDDPREGVGEQDVEQMRRWNAEHQM